MNRRRFVSEAIPSARVYRGPAPARQTPDEEVNYLRKHGAKLPASSADNDLLIPVPPTAEEIRLDAEEEQRYLQKHGARPGGDSREEDDDFDVEYSSPEDYDDEEDTTDEEEGLHLDYDDDEDELDEEAERRHEIFTRDNFEFPYNARFFNEPVARVIAKSKDGRHIFVKYYDEFENLRPLTVAIVPVTQAYWVSKPARVVRIPLGGNAYDGYGWLDRGTWRTETYSDAAKAMMDAAVKKGLVR